MGTFKVEGPKVQWLVINRDTMRDLDEPHQVVLVDPFELRPHLTLLPYKTHLSIFFFTISHHFFCKLNLSPNPRNSLSYKRSETKINVKMRSSTVADSKKRLSCNKRISGFLREGRGRLYLIRRCVVMLLCWSD